MSNPYEIADKLRSIPEPRDPAIEEAIAMIERLATTIDKRMPTIIAGMYAPMYEASIIDKEDRTAEQAGVVAAYSAAHWLMKDASKMGLKMKSEDDNYELYSVMDLMRTVKDLQSRLKDVENG